VAEQDFTFETRYTLPSKLSMLLTVPVLLSLGGFSVAFAVQHFSRDTPMSLIFIPIGLWLGYMALVTMRALPFMNVRVSVSDVGLRITRSGSILDLRWGEIGRVSHSRLRILEVRDSSDNLCLVLDTKFTGFAGLYDVLKSKRNLTNA
jgi:hypothetical protein